MSGHRLARVDLRGEWRILVVANMADDETGGTRSVIQNPM
jgi:hypothetical protein